MPSRPQRTSTHLGEKHFQDEIHQIVQCKVNKPADILAVAASKAEFVQTSNLVRLTKLFVRKHMNCRWEPNPVDKITRAFPSVPTEENDQMPRSCQHLVYMSLPAWTKTLQNFEVESASTYTYPRAVPTKHPLPVLTWQDRIPFRHNPYVRYV